MSNIIALERSFGLHCADVLQRLHSHDGTAQLSFEHHPEHRALWTYINDTAPPFMSTELLEDLIGSAHVFSTTLLASEETHSNCIFRVLASRHKGIFSLGGDLSFFRYQIDQGNREGLARYGRLAIDAIWANITASAIDDLTTVSVVQGEAQGGGFEAALSAHVLIAEKGVRFGFPEALFGMFPGMGGYTLLSARTDAQTAKRLIGSTNRYSAEMLHEMGIVDILVDKGCGEAASREWMMGVSDADRANYRKRFETIRYDELADIVEEWVDQAFGLSSRQMRTMGYILDAQKRASMARIRPSVEFLQPMVAADGGMR